MEVTAAEATGTRGDGEGATQVNKTVMGNKPLHRFIRGEPKCLGIAILILGCAELQMGIGLLKADNFNSSFIYIPFWEGALFITCGILSIYTEMHPSKKTVTVCLAMYVVTLIGILVSSLQRSAFIAYSNTILYRKGQNKWQTYQEDQIQGLEALLLTCSLCVSGILIFLSTIARFALKSSKTQMVLTMPIQS
ncbi:membrane-spanning 4-domains subfamily A member 4D isoform X2 [Osmerus eperlanus]